MESTQWESIGSSQRPRWRASIEVEGVGAFEMVFGLSICGTLWESITKGPVATKREAFTRKHDACFASAQQVVTMVQSQFDNVPGTPDGRLQQNRLLREVEKTLDSLTNKRNEPKEWNPRTSQT